MQKKSDRLPEYIIPENYNLFLEPDLKKFTFNGEVKISVKLLKPSNEIILNSKDLDIKKAEIFFNNKIISPKIISNKEKETITLVLNKTLPVSPISIFISFRGVLNSQLTGFYRSKYKNKNKTEYLATTQFEAPYARKAFPCFDEPDKKATFDLTLLINNEHKAISNTPIISEEKLKTKKLIKFQTSPLMSTYLLYIGVGKFEFLKGKYKSIEIRIVTAPGKSRHGKFALEMAKKFLEYFEEYSGIPYPLPKLDLIAVPDFAAGAMENWGAITFREILLLFDEKKTSKNIKRRIVEVIAHELWHQWSGNLVTMKWWDDLWLNESFATFMAYKAVAHYFPEWKIWEDFTISETVASMEEDSLKSTHSIEVVVNSPNEIEEIFDKISYGKGGSVLKMIESYLGREVFRKGVSHYLKKFEYKNAEANDLWNSISKMSGEKTKKIMQSWISQPGYPLIEIEQKKSKTIFRQKRFHSNNRQIWHIPLIIKTNFGETKHLLSKRKEKIKLRGYSYIKANANQAGFYRTKYTHQQLKQLAPLILEKRLNEFERLGIQNTIFNLCLFGETTLNNYLNLLKAYKNENSFLVLQDIYSNLHYIYFHFSDKKSWNKIWPKFKEHISEPFQNIIKELSWSPKKHENINDTFSRVLAISYLSFTQNREAIKKGYSIFSKNKTINPDISGAIYSLVASNSDSQKTQEKLTSKYLKEKSAEEKIKLLASLYKFRNENALKKSLDITLTEKIRTQDLRTAFSVLRANPLIKKIFVKWIIKNWKKIEKHIESHYTFTEILKTLIKSCKNKEEVKTIKIFIENKKIKYERTKAKAFEKFNINDNFCQKNSDILENYFA